MPSICRCELDFEKLNATVAVQLLADAQAIDMDGLYLHCPACGTRNLIDLRPYGFFQWQGAFYRWKKAPTKIELTARGGYRVRLGGLVLDFPESLIKDDKFSVEQICYPAVPIFAQVDEAPTAPALPIRKEYLELVDFERGVKSERTARGEYRFRFHLHVLEETAEVVLPAVPVRPDRPAAGGEEVFKGVHLVLWPNVNYSEWRRYFLRFGSAGESASTLADATRDVKVYAHASSSLEKGAEEREWLLLDTTAADGRTRYGCVEGRPDWVAVEFESRTPGGLSGGGMWQIEPATQSYTPDRPQIVGLDFGTSNTCIAWAPMSEPELLPIEGCDRYVIHGSDLPEVLDYADTWPPRQGFGRNKALLPSEILTRQTLTDLRSRAGEIRRWRPVVDYSIPSGGVGVQYREHEHIIADFKWKEMVTDAEFEPYFEDLQRRYLEFVLLYALAELAAKKAIRSTLHVNFSYPLAFDKQVVADFVEVLDRVAEAVTLQTGVSVGMERELVDEARAAAGSASGRGTNDAACLYVDIGGGSTDIALLKLNEDHFRGDEYSYICSFQYAGGALTSAMAKGGCLVPGTGIAQLRRKLREVANVKELVNTESVFLSNKRNALEAKSSYFYGYLRQFLARLLAAHIISGEWKDGVNAAAAPGAEGQRPRYHVLFYPMGNGWGFGSFIDARYALRFGERLTKEANEIIQEAIDRGVEGLDVNTPELQVNVKAIEYPKSAVAFGVLTGGARSKVREQDWDSRTILGWTTQVGRGQKVDWYQPVVGNSADPPRGQKDVPPHATLDCPDGEWPTFPSHLPRPHVLDEDLNRTRRYLARCSPGAGERKWFVDSPFHVLLEKLFKPELEKLT